MRVLLDVDGVLNAVTPTPGDHWPEWSKGSASPGGRTFRIVHAPEVARFIRRLHDEGAEVIWLTTWGAWANSEICPLLDLPEFVVAGEPHEYNGAGWWKLPLAQALYEADGKPFVWLDDDLSYERDAQAWLATLPEGAFLAVSPDTNAGLTPRQLAKIEAFIKERGGEGSMTKETD